MNNSSIWSKKYLQGLIILVGVIFSGILLGASLVSAINHVTHPPIEIMTLNQEALFKEEALRCAKLNLDEKSLKKHLADFKKAFMDLLKNLPKHFVVVPSSLLLRTDNIQDLTEIFRTLLIESQQELKK